MPATSDSTSEGVRRFTRFAAAASIVVHLMFIALFAWWGSHILAWLNILSVATHTYAFWQTRPGGELPRASSAIAWEVGLHAIAATLLLGWDSGFHYFMIPLAPAALLSSVRTVPVRLRIAGTIALAYVALRVWTQHVAPWQPAADLDALHTLEMGCIAVLMVSLIALAYRYQAVFFQAQQALERAAYTDPLTGALNRRRLQELATQQRGDATAYVMLCDLDHFKRINDSYGHDAGDTVLQTFYQHLVQSTRSTDWVCRWGGEEFLVVMPHTDLEEARSVAQRLQVTLCDHPISISPTQTLQVTTTIGLAALAPQEALLMAVQRADHALYTGKNLGRNRIVPASETMPTDGIQ